MDDTSHIGEPSVGAGACDPPARFERLASDVRARKPATRETILRLRWWTSTLVSLRVTRNPSFRFTPGHYARVGLFDASGQPVFRPLSIASAPADSELELFCTLVPGGALSTLLAACRAGDPLEIEKASYGFHTLASLAPGKELWLLASGTGLAPYLSIVRDDAAWSAFERIVVVHSVRKAADLAYADELRELARRPRRDSERAQLSYLPIVTREPGATALSERITALLTDGRLAGAAGVPLDPARSRVMVCGNPDMTRELRALLGERGFRTTRRGVLGEAAFEKYW
jgi:ferredoxin--NADP+ reductase